FFGYASWLETIGIVFAVVLATMLATHMEHKNENTFQALQNDASKEKPKVFRSLNLCEIDIDAVVRRDKILLQPGDMIPADGFIITGHIEVNQSALNGESEPSEKFSSDDRYIPTNFNRRNYVFRGTTVVSGEAVMDVEAVGDQTGIGKLAQGLESDEERDGPLKVKLSKLAGQISMFGYIGGSFIALAYAFKMIVMDNAFEMTKIIAFCSDMPSIIHVIATSIILAMIIIVVAVPEGLPMMIAIVLAQNMKKLLGEKVLVRKLVGIETCGSMNVCMLDKTGTLTYGELCTESFIDPAGKKFNSCYDLHESTRKRTIDNLVLNSSSTFSNQEEVIGGNSTDQSLLKFIGMGDSRSDEVVKDTLYFDSQRKYSAVSLESGLTMFKGAPDVLLPRCTEMLQDGKLVKMEESLRSNIIKDLKTYEDQGYRIIALADSSQEWENDKSLPSTLILIGHLILRDTLRADAKETIQNLSRAGINVIMLTGDKAGTAEQIA
ncbi:MAG: cation-transporting P-type ATPase, partial [bacterium]|nr:cation-transporting P-type ATPase [bacterium]